MELCGLIAAGCRIPPGRFYRKDMQIALAVLLAGIKDDWLPR